MGRLQEQADERRRAARVDRALEGTEPARWQVVDPHERTLWDVADEIGPVLRLPAGTAVPRVENAPRTVSQLRADVLAVLLLEGEPADMPERLRGIPGQVTVTVPVLALLERTGPGPGGGCPGGGSLGGGCPGGGFPGSGELPGASGWAQLAGCGPLLVSTAERTAAGAACGYRVLTRPVTGTVLDHDRATDAVPADLRRRLRARDTTCRFPGCRRLGRGLRE